MKTINKRASLKEILDLYPETRVVTPYPADSAFCKEELINDLICAGLSKDFLFKSLEALEIDGSVAGSKMLSHCLDKIQEKKPYTFENTIPFVELILNCELDRSYRIFTEAAVTICNLAANNRVLDEVIGITSGRTGIDHFVLYPVRLIIFFAISEKYEIRDLMTLCKESCTSPNLQSAFDRVIQEREHGYLSPKETARLEAAVFNDSYFQKIMQEIG